MPEQEPESSTLVVEDRRRTWTVSYRHRKGREETLLYLHGLGTSKEDFLGAWDVAAWAGHALVAFDAPGCGATRGHGGGTPLGVEDIVRVAEALIAELALSGVTVIGHSMGGLAGLLLTLRNRGAIRRLASVEGNLGPEDCSILSRRVSAQDPSGRAEDAMRAVERDLRASGAPGFEEFADRLRARVQPRAFVDYCRSIVEYSDNFPLLDAFIGLEMPRLYVHGSANAHLTHIPRLKEAGVRVCSVPDSDHFPACSNPGFYYRALADFVAQTGR